MAVSNTTAQGQQLIDALELMWAEQASPSGGQAGSTTPGGQSTEGRLAPYAVPTDPYLNNQWHLFNVGQVVNPGQFQDLFGVPGQDVNVIPAWDLGYTGAGVFVAVVDDGVQLDHPDLAANISLQYAYDAIRNRPGGGTLGADDNHGTAVAGLIGAVGNNGIGGVGVAYGANIIPIKFLGAGATDQTLINAIGANGAPVDIYNHSWGPSFDFYGRAVAGPTPQEFIALSNSARLGRNGLGAIHVFASGNSAEGLHSAGSNGYVNSRYTIGVGMVDHDGTVPNSDGTITKYGEMAPSVLIVAPSASGPTDIINDFNTGSGIFTTDRTPNLGYNIPALPSGVELDIDVFPDEDYTTRFGGTSAATPIASGVIALMLEANPNLTYRDVQEILVRSARQNDDLDESWITNLVPLFRDPFPHSPFPDNYPIDPAAPLYPSDESQWNDEIVYQLLPGTIATPAVPATTGPVPTAFGEFTVTAVADKPWDGWVANNLTVVFRTEPGDIPSAEAQIVKGTIRVTVAGDGVTWGDIEAAIELLGQDPFAPNPMDAWFEVMVSDPLLVFDPSDESIRAPLTGGVDATGTDSVLQINPQYLGYHPIADPLTNPEPLSLFTNGAGYTVSHGRGGDSEYGWAHGVVNAQLAVQLAEQWHLKDQNLPPEKTYLVGGFGGIKIRAAQVTNEESGEYVIPGGLSQSNEGFAEYFNEFFKEVTFTEGDAMAMPPTLDTVDVDSLPFREDDPPVNTRGIPLVFDVPAIDPVTGASNLMSLEWVDIQLSITGDADAMNYLRITLVSPDGTHSELTQNQYRPANIQHNFQSMATGGVHTGLGDSITPIDENGGNTDTLNWVYSTNRIWGERSDSKPVFNEYGDLVDFKGWELHFENYSGADLFLNGASIAFHGSAIGSSAAPVERVMGKVGVDSGRFIVGANEIIGANDGEFNFDRYITTPSSNSLALTTPSLVGGFSDTPFGVHKIAVADPLQESFAGNATVYVIDNASGQRVAEFVTGYDGNYYFDLPAGEYTIGVEDPLGREALADGRNYDSEWVITVDGEDFASREAGMIDEVTGKFQYLNNLNFLLDPGSIPVGEVVFTGQVIGDLDGDGTQDAQDVGVYNFLVYADLNHTGQFELGEPFTYTDPDGNYELHVPTATPNTFSITVKPPAGWTATSPTTAVINEYAQPGDLVDGFKYFFEPPSSPTGIGNGTIFGFIFNDKNGDGIQQINESGLGGVVVYVDADLDGEYDEGVETSTITSATGAYQFGDVGLGTVRIDAVVEEPFLLTAPAAGFIDITLIAGQVSQNNNFAVQNLAVNDFGDLVGDGFRTYGVEPASHAVVPGFSLGATIDAEVRSRNLVETAPGSGIYVPDPSLHGIGDDQDVSGANFDDEDGVVLVGGILRPGANTLSVTVSGVGGYLQGWIDFNDNDAFDVGEQVFTNVDLVPGTHQLLVTAPQSLANGQVAARFRWGTIDNTYFGHDNIGEVEDYLFEAKVPVPGDFNADDVVDDADYLLWKSTFGSTIDLRADGNQNGVIDTGDYTVWRNNLGAGLGAGGGGASLAAASSTLEPAASLQAEQDYQFVIDQWLAQLATRASAVRIAGLGQLGAQSVVVNGVTRYAVSAPAARQVGGGGAVAVEEMSPSNLVSVEVTAPLSLTGLRFSTNVGHTVGDSLFQNGVSNSGDNVDLALLLLAAHDMRRGQSSADDDAFAADARWLAGDGDPSDELDLALAAAFEEEVDWRGML